MDSTSQTNQLLLPSSSSSLPRSWNYDVFLSFRGEDTRKSFTDHLFAALCRAGVRTFRDAEELRKGEDISTDLIKAIQESKISIIVFSKTYASSRWCLDELVKIVECKEKVNQVVLPIFYDVDPSQVRKQTGGFGEDLAQHQQQFGTKKVSQWKTTLTKVANFSGWDLRNIAEGYESNFIDNIVENVLQVVNHTYFDVAKYPVGIHARAREVLSLLKSEVDGDVRMIGIYGMGGVGKTTLAKAVFNQIYRSFDGSCFLGDVRQKCLDGGRAALKCLQEQLLCDTLNRKTLEVHNADRGISLIKERLGLKHVLIVVDDVEDKSQLDALVGERDWFGSGSRIIITTRNVNLLNGFRGECEKYNVQVLSSEESLQLFSWHAFKNPSPFEAFVELSNMIVSYIGGLPLALTTLGSHFGARSSIQEWTDDFDKLKRIPHGPHKNILETLKISYDALDDDTQRIFLDIACFFTSRDLPKGDIVKILNGCGFYAQSGIRTLIDRCLLEESLRMHDLVRDMGREIVRKESSMQPEKRSRLFLCDEVFDVLTNNKGTNAIETMIINDFSNKVRLSTKVFSKMTKLRALKIYSSNVKGSLKYLSNELRYLYWFGCPLSRISSDLCLEKLVILEMNKGNIKEFKPKLQHFRCLQILRLNHCYKLKRAPNFVGAHSLKELSFWGCSKLVKLSQSIGDLENLVKLDLSNCKDLNALPSSICNLKSLKYLNLHGCSKIKELPIDFGKLKWLEFLDARETSVTNLPISCGSLRPLKYLMLGTQPSYCYWEYYGGECIGHSNTNLCSLETLQTPYEYVQHLDLQIGDGGLSLLTVLDLSDSDFDTLPFNLSHLSKLRHLVLNNCPNLLGIEDDLPLSLYEFSVQNCPLLKSIPDLSGLLRLESLYLDKCSNLIEVVGVENLVNLRTMNLCKCSNLIELQGIENLVRLNYMDIRGCSALSSKYWCENLLKGLFKSPNIGHHRWVSIGVSKEMVPQYLRRRSNEVGECSYANYTTLPLFLKNKRIFIIVMVSWSGESGPNKELECLVYEQPNEVEEVMVLIEFSLFTLKEVEDNLSIETYIVYEDDGELYFFPINSKVVYKFNPKTYKSVDLTLTTVSTTPTFYIVR